MLASMLSVVEGAEGGGGGILMTSCTLDCQQSLSGQSRWCAHSPATLGRGEIYGIALLAVTNAFEFPVAPATENSDWSINNGCCQTSLMCN